MKTLVAFLVFARLASGQAPGKIMTFNRSDTEHCTLVTVENAQEIPSADLSNLIGMSPVFNIASKTIKWKPPSDPAMPDCSAPLRAVPLGH